MPANLALNKITNNVLPAVFHTTAGCFRKNTTQL